MLIIRDIGLGEVPIDGEWSSISAMIHAGPLQPMTTRSGNISRRMIVGARRLIIAIRGWRGIVATLR